MWEEFNMTYPARFNDEKNGKRLKMDIQGNKLIGELQQEFNSYFPFLRIEFFRKRTGDAKAGIEKLGANQKLQFLNGNSDKVAIHIDKNDRVVTLKDHFNKFGIGVLVFRKAGKVWVETTLTEDWTLERQNIEGELFSRK